MERKGYDIRAYLPRDMVEAVSDVAYKIDVTNRDELERELTRRLGREFSKQVDELMRLLGNPPKIENVPALFWQTSGIELRQALVPFLSKLFVEQATATLGGLPFGVDWALINSRAMDWARRYTFDLVRGIEETSLDALQRAIGSFYENGLTRGDLEDMLQGAFGDTRASMIAVTEVTRASSEGEMGLKRELEAQGITMTAIWNTNNDELVCDICGPLNQKAQGDGWDEAPPAHPNCRCWVNLELPK
jgi:hypothetical protein